MTWTLGQKCKLYEPWGVWITRPFNREFSEFPAVVVGSWRRTPLWSSHQERSHPSHQTNTVQRSPQQWSSGAVEQWSSGVASERCKIHRRYQISSVSISFRGETNLFTSWLPEFPEYQGTAQASSSSWPGQNGIFPPVAIGMEKDQAVELGTQFLNPNN